MKVISMAVRSCLHMFSIKYRSHDQAVQCGEATNIDYHDNLIITK